LPIDSCQGPAARLSTHINRRLDDARVLGSGDCLATLFDAGVQRSGVRELDDGDDVSQDRQQVLNRSGLPELTLI